MCGDENDPGDGKKYFRHEVRVFGEPNATNTTAAYRAEYRDVRGQVVKEYAGEGAERVRVSGFSYDLLGNLTKRVDALGNETVFEYDYAGRATKTTRGTGSAVTVYDALGNRREQGDFRGNITRMDYDAAGRLLKQESGFDSGTPNRKAVTEYEYDTGGNLIRQRVFCGNSGDTAVWREMRYTYDGRNRQRSASVFAEGKEERTEYRYDAAGNRTEVRTGGNGGVVTRYTYDGFGNVLEMTDSLWQRETYLYDKIGRLLEKTDRNGNKTGYTRDALGRLTKETVTVKTASGKEIRTEREHRYTQAGAKLLDISREWTGNGSTQKPRIMVQYVYNSRGQLTEQHDFSGGGSVAVKRYSYDANGNRTTFRLVREGIEEISLSYGYDALNRLTEVRKSGTVVASYLYDANGNRVKTSYPAAGLETSCTYNKANLITTLTNRKDGETVSSFAYGYSPDGNRISETETKRSGGTETSRTTDYEYDGAGRLAKESDPERTVRYLYDRFSNRSRMTVTPAAGSAEKKSVTTYEYDRNNRLLTETKKTEDKDRTTETYRYSYDPNGNQIRKERSVTRAETYAKTKRIGWTTEKKEKPTLDLREYNGFNQLIYCHRDVTDIYYTYRPDGMRHSVESGHSWNGTGMTKTVHHWDGTDIVLESGGNGNIKSRFLRGINLISQNIGENDFYYVFNAHGDVIQKWNRQLNVLAENYEYDAFGNQRKIATVPGTDIETDANPFRYCGEYFDKETEEYYLRARQYDAGTGRFTTEDPARSGRNWYGYGGNNPVRYGDPTGLSFASSSLSGAKKVAKKPAATLSRNERPGGVPKATTTLTRHNPSRGAQGTISGIERQQVARGAESQNSISQGVDRNILITGEYALSQQPRPSKTTALSAEAVAGGREILGGLAGTLPLVDGPLPFGDIIAAGILIYLLFSINSTEKVDSGSGSVANLESAKTVEDLLEDATPGRTTKGRTEQWEKDGDYEQALEDYESLMPGGSTDIDTTYGAGKTGTLPDGHRVTVRPGSSDGRPTLEIRGANGRGIEIRYGS